MKQRTLTWAVVAMAILLVAPGVMAQESAVQIDFSGPVPSPPEGTSSCSIVNVQAGITSGFLSWNIPGGGLAVWYDPNGSGAAGAPGCGTGSCDFASNNFRINDIFWNAGDESAFGTGTGVADFDYTLTIHDAATPGDPCTGPGALLWDSGTLTFNATGAGLNPITVPVGAEFSGPVFVLWSLISTSVATETLSPLWDNVARPTCLQWVTQDGGAMFTDFTTFFTTGTTGWVDMTVNGDCVSAQEQIEVPTLNQYGLAVLLLALTAAGIFFLRRRFV